MHHDHGPTWLPVEQVQSASLPVPHVSFALLIIIPLEQPVPVQHSKSDDEVVTVEPTGEQVPAYIPVSQVVFAKAPGTQVVVPT